MLNRTMSLGELIGALERKDPDVIVCYDFAYFHPTQLQSWRGDYSQLSLGYSSEGDDPKVSALLATLKEAVGKTFTGWKGGQYEMCEDTPVWVSNAGEACHTAIVDVEDTGLYVTLRTWRHED